jgi:hypothetical protein
MLPLLLLLMLLLLMLLMMLLMLLLMLMMMLLLLVMMLLLLMLLMMLLVLVLLLMMLILMMMILLRGVQQILQLEHGVRRAMRLHDGRLRPHLHRQVRILLQEVCAVGPVLQEPPEQQRPWPRRKIPP